LICSQTHKKDKLLHPDINLYLYVGSYQLSSLILYIWFKLYIIATGY